MFKSLLKIIPLFLFCFSCGKSLPHLDGVDSPKWKDDKNGCTGARASMKEAITREREKLLALEQMQIIELLGKPDRNELYKRNQKFFVYFIEPAPKCMGDSISFKTEPLKLAIRFNAMGLAKEVAIE